MILQVEVVPLSHELITGYSIAIGWDETNSYYSFRVEPSGDCSVIRFKNFKGPNTAQIKNCPKPEQGKRVVTRLEVINSNVDVFIDGLFIGSWSISEYEEGKIGLGAVSGGNIGSGVQSKVAFNNLVIWKK